MSKIDYVIRESGLPELISANSEWEFLDTEEILENYPYILEAMKKENYYLENDFCSFFDELLFEDKVVGFATFNFRNYDEFLLTECFILPEFRGNRIFFNELCKMYFVGSSFGILQPTRDIIDLLLDYSFAINFNENIVVSAFEFYFDDIDAKSTLNSDLDDDEMEPSNFYDLSINSTIFVDGDEVIYHDLLENDLRKHGQRKKLDDEYFTNLKEIFSKNEYEFDDLIDKLKDELPKTKFGFDEVVGRNEGLSEFMQTIVDGGLLTYDEAIDVKEQLTEEYESGLINDDDIDHRLTEIISAQKIQLGDFDELKEMLISEEFDVEHNDLIKDFFDVIGDNQSLGRDIMEAALNDDYDSFEHLLMDAMANDERFLDDFIDFTGERYDDDSFVNNDMSLLDDDNNHDYKLEDIEYGKDYPISYDRDIYHYLEILDGNINYSRILDFHSLEFNSDEVMTNLMLESGLINIEGHEIDWINKQDSFNISELKEILRSNNLKVSGNKNELLKRLSDNKVTYGEIFKITQKGKDFLKEYSWIGFYEGFLSDFDFNDYCRYKENHEGKLKEVALNYLEEHINKASENDDEEYLNCSNIAKNLILDEGSDFIKDLNIPE